MKITVDLETSCAIECCVGYRGSSKCKHALSPWTGNIDLIGVTGEDIRITFTNISDYMDYYELLDSPECTYHNGSFDVKYLVVKSGNDQFIESMVDDTQLMIHVCTQKVPESWLNQYEQWRKEENKKLPVGISHRQAGANSLKTNAPFWLGVKPFWEDPSNHNDVTYCLTDCDYTTGLREKFESIMTGAEYIFYKEFMIPVSKMLIRAELRGVQLDLSALNEMQLELNMEALELKEKLDSQWAEAHKAYWQIQADAVTEKYNSMYEKAVVKAKDASKCLARYMELKKKALDKIPRKLNYDSPKQMLWLLKDYLNLSVTTFTGEESTGKAVLQDLASNGHEDIKLFLDWREINKILTSFLPKYKTLQTDSGSIHPNFNLTGTRTGRLSSSNPNLQQVPSKLYKLFRPRDGYTFLQHDQAAIEGKLIGLYSNDPEVMKASAPGQSIHNSNAKAFFELECNPSEVPEKYPEQRKAAKTCGFALFYGAGSGRIKHAFTSAGFPTSDEQAKGMLKNFKATYKNAFKFHREVTKVFERGECIENLFGRPIKIPDPGDAYMKGFNTLVQSSASDLVLAGALKAQQKYDELGLDAHVLLLIHDFVMAEAKKDIAEQADEILIDCMTNWNLGDIILEVDGGISDIWTK